MSPEPGETIIFSLVLITGDEHLKPSAFRKPSNYETEESMKNARKGLEKMSQQEVKRQKGLNDGGIQHEGLKSERGRDVGLKRGFNCCFVFSAVRI